MEVLYAHCAGLDVHKDTVVACVRHMHEATVKREVRTFKTMTRDLLALSEWLASEGCTHIAMEATGVYWKPVWHILSDGDFALTLANAAHEQKTLEDANIKLDSVISDITGASGWAMIEALIAGETDPEKLAGLAHRRIKAPPALLREALRGRVSKHHRFLLRLHQQQIVALDAAISEIDREVEANIAPFRTAISLLITIPGINSLSSRGILAEIGTDMSRFATARHIISWAGFCPGNDESAGKRRSNRMRKGAPWLKTTLIQCAWAAVRKNGSYLQAQFHRLRARRGAKKAITAVAASMLTAAYHMLKDGTLYQDLGANHFDRTSKPAQTKRLIARLQNLGYEVQITPAVA